MRPLELALVVANVLALGLGFRTTPQGMIRWAAALNLAALLLHAAVEGLRLQLTLSYGVTGVIVFGALVTWLRRTPGSQRLGALRATGLVLALALVAASALLATAFPVFTLPRPTGGAAVGVTYLPLVDHHRTEPFLRGSTRNRELMVKISYPAVDDPHLHHMRYFRGSTGLIRAFTRGYGLPEVLLDQLGLVQTHSKEGLTPLVGRPRPVILFSHGGGTGMEVQTAQGEDLASQGYVVVAIDHPYVAGATLFPDRLVTAKEATTTFTGADPVVTITGIMAQDVRFVLDELTRINSGAVPSPLQGQLDLDQVGVIGQSLGGAVAYDLALHDPRIKAAIDLDGSVYVAPDDDHMAPFLMLVNDRFHLQAIQARDIFMTPYAKMTHEERQVAGVNFGSRAAYERAFTSAQQNMTGLVRMLKRSRGLYTVQGSDHMKFTDIGLWLGFRPLRELMGIGGSTDPRRCLAITEGVTLAFFNQQLRGEGGSWPARLLDAYPELRQVELRE